MGQFSIERKLAVTAFLIGLAGFLFQIGLQHRMRPFASKDGYFHRWSSEHFMQVLPIEDLRDEPFITLLSTTLILWMYYLLLRLRRNPKAGIISFSTVVLILFFTRSIFQLPFFLFLAGSLALLKVPIRKVSTFLAITITIAGLYVEKQYIQFGILTTSSFSGLNLVKSIGGMSNKDFYSYWKGYEVLEHTELPRYPLPDVMLRRWKWTNTPNFNHIGYLQKNKQLIQEFKMRLTCLFPNFSNHTWRILNCTLSRHLATTKVSM